MTATTQLGAPLTDRELQVLGGMSRGKSNSDIGRELYLSEDTVKTHGRRLFGKLGASDRAHAVSLAYQAGILAVGDATVTPIQRVVVRASSTASAAAPPSPTPGAPTVAIEVSERGAVRLVHALYPEHVQAPWAFERCTDGLRRLADQGAHQ